MKKIRGMEALKRVVFLGIILGGVSLAIPLQARAASTCSDCHGMPPIDAPYRNITTGGFKGNHQTHQPAVATPVNCAVCHAGSNMYTEGHRNGIIEMTQNLNSSPVPALYSKGVFFNQTTIPVMGTCANVNCHFEAVTTPWGSAPLTSPAGCNACHGNPPSDGNHPGIAGAGKKHGDYYGTTTASCVKCHPDHSTAAKPFAHATSAGKRGLLLRFTAAPNTGGSYSKTTNLAYPNYLPSQTPAANRNGTCANMFCHSDGTGGAPKVAAVWGGTLPADCSGCHGSNATSAVVVTTGLHAQHVNNAAVLGTNNSCAACHGTTVGAGSDRTVTTLGNHLNSSVNVSFSGGGTYNATAKSCSTTVCHAAGKATAPQPAAPSWTGPAMGCNGCHGRSNATGTPDYANGGAGVPLANSHAKHVSSAADCDACHTNTTTSGTAIKAGSTLHTNGPIEVTFNTAKAGASATWTAGTKTCANTYCHGTSLTGGTVKSPVWGATLTGCGTCHGYPPATTSGVHTGVTATQCINCHPHVNAAGTGFTDATKHINYVIDAAGGDCITCHGSVQNVVRRTVTGPSGDFVKTSHHVTNGTTTQIVNVNACIVCHGDLLASRSHPNGLPADPQVDLMDPDTGAFVANTAAGVEQVCSKCHDAGGATRAGLPSGSTATQPFNTAGDNRTPVNIGWTAGTMAHSAGNACLNCHDNSHGSANAKMTRFVYNAADTVSTATNFCYNCHGNTVANGAVNAVKTTFDTTYGHNNIKCQDCHGVHQAKAGNHTAGSTTLAGVLNGVAGRSVTWSAVSTWPSTSNATFTAITQVTMEYQVCFKSGCHAGTGFAAGGAGALAMTDLAVEFNPNNASRHPIGTALATGARLTAAKLAGGWAPGAIMTCTDCHATDSSGQKGPHGSSVKWMLTGTTKAWPYITAAANGTADTVATNFYTLATTGTQAYNANPTAANGLFCRNCHPILDTNTYHVSSATKRTSHRNFNMACVNCHIRVPHGGKIGRLLLTPNAPARYKANGNGTYSGSNTITKMPAQGGAINAFSCSGGEHTGGTQAW
ncbi:MAG: hypothetical protein FD174_1111 [Geobacteraceae bacterium]|nr:MAG: hypothetical protein FD174_1111 [Geobacteraceae bacterium]